MPLGPHLLNHEDQTLRQRRIMAEVTAYETPRVLGFLVALIAGFDLLYATLGVVAPASYYHLDLLQVAVLLGCTLGLLSGRLPERFAPAALMTSIVANSVATNLQAAIVGDGALAVFSIMLAVAGSVALRWRPFLIGAVLATGTTAIVRSMQESTDWVGWTVAIGTGFCLGAIIMRGRRRSLGQLARAVTMIEALATLDPLTELLNRRGLNETTAVMLPLAQRHASETFAIFVDVAELKAVNKVYGHAAGDVVLRNVAKAVKSQARSSDAVCRWGGDEFVVVGVGAPPDADTLERRIVDAIDQAAVSGFWRPAVWLGVASAAAGVVPIDRLIEVADEDMQRRRAAQSG